MDELYFSYDWWETPDGYPEGPVELEVTLPYLPASTGDNVTPGTCAFPLWENAEVSANIGCRDHFLTWLDANPMVRDLMFERALDAEPTRRLRHIFDERGVDNM